MWDDFFHEPTVFEEQVEEFKESLRAAVRGEITQEMDRLRKENDSLRDIRDNWNKKVRELEDECARKRRELDAAVQEAHREAAKAKTMRLEQLVNEVAPVAWTFELERITKPKCDLCDKLRKRHFVTPLGRNSYEDCECAETKYKYHVKRAPLVRMYTNPRGELMTFFLTSEGDGLYRQEENRFFDDTPFEEIRFSRPLFHDENRARRYAAWHNQKEGLT